MKTAVILILCIGVIFSFPVCAVAYDEYSERLFDALDSDTKKLLEQFGISEDIGDSFGEISPLKAIETIKKLFTDGFSELASAGILCGALILITAAISAFLSSSAELFMMSKSIALMTVMFSAVRFTGEIFTDCCSSMLVTKDFMLVLIPVFTGIISFSGNPALAVSFNSVVFSFSEIVTLGFENIVPRVSAVLVAVQTAGAVNPFMRLDGITRTISKALTLFMAFTAGIFVAVLSVRGVIAGAADSVTIRGLRFLIGNSVPVVGSAIGEALNSVVAGLGLIKNTVGVIGIAGVVVINIPSVIRLLCWKGILYVVGIIADITGCTEMKSFFTNLSSALSLIAGAMCFIAFVFVISIAIIITVSRS